MDPESLLDGLNDEQRAAAEQVTGPVVIHAGAGTGKTRVISHRTAFAAATGAMDPGHALLVTFTDKAAGQMSERIRHLGVPGVATMTFHSAAWRQLRHFTSQDGESPRPLTILSQPWRLVAPLVRRLPGHYRFTPTQDVLEAISWIKTSRLTPADLTQQAASATALATGRTLPLPPDLLVRVWHSYERAKADQSLIDFDDMLLRTADLLRDRPDFVDQVRDRYSWFSVDEFQDTNPVQFELLRLWIGDRQDVCVVGDRHQTIYTFTGATPGFLTGFRQWFPRAVSIELTTNYRSSAQILGLANRLVHDQRPLVATRADGPAPRLESFTDAGAEVDGIVASVIQWREAGLEYSDMAVLVRLNADLAPIESGLTRAGVPFTVRGTQFFQRREVSASIRVLAQRGPTQGDLAAWFADVLTTEFGYEVDDTPGTPEARERHAALGTLLSLIRDLAVDPDREGVITELRRRSEAEQDSDGVGVTLATVHRAKGLEWDAVHVAGLEDGHLPVQQAIKSPELLAEEQRLLYVAITRAKQFLTMSWSGQREGANQKVRSSRRSRFLDELFPRVASRERAGRPAVTVPREVSVPGGDDPLYERLKTWRLEVARAEAVPAYVVFSNSTLALIARDRPATVTALAGISGVGPTKLDRYGGEVLQIVEQEVATVGEPLG